MMDLSQLSDEELMSMIQPHGASQGGQASGQPETQPQSDLDLSMLSDEELMGAINQSSGSGGSRFLSSTPIETQTSAISNIDRLRLSFADDEGKQNFLKEKFSFVQKDPQSGKYLVGDNINNLQPIDPDTGFSELLGDLADIVGEIPTIAGQMVGATVGTGMNPGVGTFVGGTIGSGIGESAKIGIGKVLGVQQGEAMEDATDIAISTAFGAVGEGLAAGTQLTGKGLKRVIAPKLTKLMDNIVKKTAKLEGVNPEATLPVKTIAKTFKVLANIPEKSTETIFKYGVEETLGNPANLSKRSVLKHIDTVIDSVKGTQDKLGAIVGKQKDAFIRVTADAGEKIKVGDIAEYVVKEAKDLGIIDNFNQFVPRVNLANSKDVGPIRQILSDIAEISSKGVRVNPDKSISGKEALRLSKVFGDSFDGMSQNAKNIINAAIGNNDKAAFKGLRMRVRDTASKVGLNEFASTMDNFSNFMNLKNNLTALKQFKPDKIESFIKRLENIGEWNGQTLSQLDDFVKSTGGKSFIKKIEQWNAAQDFVGSNPNIMRFTAVAATLGALTGFDTSQSKAGTIGGALLLGTPAGARTLLRAGSKLAKTPTRIAANAARASSVASKTDLTPAALSQFLRQINDERKQKNNK